MIEINALSKTFKSSQVETLALNDINIGIQEGEFVSVMGPSGCGKSTLLNIIGLLDMPSAGTYYFKGEEVSSLQEKERAHLRKNNIGFVFQNFNLIDELTVFENVELPLKYLGLHKKERKEMVLKLLERMQLMHRTSYFPVELSGGQQQRVAIARAVISNPRLILADEPTGNLDSIQGNDVMEMLRELNQAGTTIVMVTHSQNDADYSGRIIRLFDGQVVSENFRQRPQL